MAEESTEKELKLAGLKGINTANPDGEPETNPILQSSKDKITSSDAYIKPDTKDQSFISDLASAGVNGVTSDTIKGTNFTIDPIAKNLFTPVDLAKAIPDPIERAKYIKEHGNKMTQLLDPETYGITFNRQIADYAGYRKQNYPKQLKKFVDDLDENQGWVSSLGNNFAKLLGSTTAKIGANMIAPIYGLGSALMNNDSTKIRDNNLIDFFEEMDEDITKEFVVYGGYDYGKELDDAGNVVGQQTFFSRLFSHPFKSINDDIVPTVAFVAGAVTSEMILGRLGIHIGASKLARGFFRAGAFTAQKFAKGYRVIRGLDKLSDIESMRRVIKVSNAMTKGAGKIATMYRSAAYESALIGNDTESNTLMQSKFGYIKSSPELLRDYQQLIAENTDEFGNLELTQEELIDQIAQRIPPGVLAQMEHSARSAGKAAYLTNIPLVGASYMIQFPKIFGTSYRGGQKILSKTGPLYGATMEGGKLVSRFSKAKGFEKLVFKYALPSLKAGGTEAFEEFSQGVIEKGYADYWSAPYSDTSLESSIGFLQAMGSASRKYVKSVEGIDSITLGFLMGFLGIPMVKTKASGKVGLGWSGGFYEAISEVGEKISEVEAAIKAYNDGPQTNEVLKNNFDAFRANVTIQEQKEKALEEGDVYNYKNAEHDELHNYVENKMQNGILDTVYQDIEALKEMSLEEFNKQFAHKEADYQFTEESKKKNLETFEENVDQTVKAFDATETVFNDKRAWIDRFFAKDYTGLNPIKEFATQDIKNAVKDQPETEAAVRNYIRNKQNVFKKKVFSLLSTTNNLQKREKELQDRLRELAPNANLTALMKNENYKEVLAALEKGDKIYFAEEEGKKKLDSFISEILSNIKEENFENYNLNKDEIKSLVNDIFKIKSRRAKISEIYSTLFTKKGANKWLTLQAELENRFQEELLDNVRKQAEEAVEKKQDAASLKTVLDNYRQIFKEELPANSEKITEQLNKLKSKLSDTESFSYEEIIDLLKDGKNTNLIEHIFEVLNNRDQMPNGLKFSLDNIDQFKDNQEFKDNFLNAFATIYNNFENIIEEISDALTNPGNKKVQNTTPEPSNEGFEEDTKEAVTLDSMLDELIEEDTKGVIPTINEKKILFDRDTKKLVGAEPGADGKPVEWYDKDGPSNQPDIKGYNMKLVNSPDWLSNEYLEKKNVTATFKFSEDEYGDKTKYGASNIGINVFHGDVFIGRLPVATSDPSSIALREALYNGKVDKDGTILGKEDTAVTQEYSGYQAVIVPAAPKTETTKDPITDTPKDWDINNKIPITKLHIRKDLPLTDEGIVPSDPIQIYEISEESFNNRRATGIESLYPKVVNAKGELVYPETYKEYQDYLKQEYKIIESKIKQALKQDTVEKAQDIIGKILARDYGNFINEVQSIKDFVKARYEGKTDQTFAEWSQKKSETKTKTKETTTPEAEVKVEATKATKAEEEANKKTIINFLNSKKSFEELSEEEKNKLAIVWQFQFVKASETEPLNMSKDLKDLINSDEVNRPDLTKLEDNKDVMDFLVQIVNPIEQFVDNKINEFIKNNLDLIKQSGRYYERFKRVGKEEYDEISEQSSIFDIKNVFSDSQVLQLLSENKIDFGKTKKVAPETEVEASDKIIWAHPGLGKTTFKKSNPENAIDFDTDFKPAIAKALGLPKNKQNSKGLNEWRKNNSEEDFKVEMRKAWKKAVSESKKTGKMLLVSDMMFLKENESDFDKVINTSKETFIERATKRGDNTEDLDSWKSNIDKTLSNVDSSKVVSTNKYFSEIQPTQQTSEVETEVEQSARGKVIDKNFKSIIKALGDKALMQGTQYVGQKKC